MAGFVINDVEPSAPWGLQSWFAEEGFEDAGVTLE